MAETPKPKSQTPTPKPKPKPTDEQTVEPAPQQSTLGKVGSVIGGLAKKGLGKLADNIGKQFGSNAPQPGAENKPAEGQKKDDDKKDPQMEMIERYMKLVEQWQGGINKPFYWVGGKISAGASFLVDKAVEGIKNKLAESEQPKPNPNSSTQQSNSSSSSSSSSTTPTPTSSSSSGSQSSSPPTTSSGSDSQSSSPPTTSSGS
ncbi:TPA: lpg2844 family Dot/Icm T4SS effector, partial [Legionella pneumophila]|nr:lpg2844 family Dot/Icm T4SS effector [Legionella pneumophila subsp. pneumophila]HAU0197955.1 lpg2844 family Dot/Icm T4SS effector [Legionella pneumophila]HAT9559066.1 lpg2844 family Dot/Icm T4SS effector [Legionella pneumophila subsp. pneumophila]HAT9706964.1 lpg2844 family Dot/Icm T4SS effector [Legionella pneumophila subsp. pneumophila]HAU0284777.1 lpg2844 family Dot/Icm T4SS effector [Legionella pneumophila]